MCNNPRQCKSKDLMHDSRCQGIPNHKGPHWAYDSGGQLIQWVNKKDRCAEWKNIACRWIPPGYKTWISPVDMINQHYITIWANNEKKANKKRHNKKANAKVGKIRKR